jgi:hypothetical protein
VVVPDIELRTAEKRKHEDGESDECKRPRYLRELVWAENECFESLSILATFTAPPLPSPPISALSDRAVAETVRSNPDLFRIITPINVDRFYELLAGHPNRELVESVCRGFREGFWPWADTSLPGYPTTWDNSQRPISEPAHQQFLRNQRDTEIELGQYSPSFGTELLPGMYAMPLGVVPKPRSEKLRLINDLSAGEYSCNSMIPQNEHSVRLDGMRALGGTLHHVREQQGDVPLVLWKSDVSRTY